MKLKRFRTLTGLLVFVGALLSSSAGVFADSPLTVQSKEVVSVASDGTPGNNGAGMPSMSRDGRYVMFVSTSTNLISGITIPTGPFNSPEELYIYDRQTKTMTLASHTPDGQPAQPAVYRSGGISDDGRYILFMSTALDLTPDVNGDPLNGAAFMEDRQTGIITQISVPVALSSSSRFETTSYDLSGDGNIAVYEGGNSGRDLIHIYNRQTAQTVDIPGARPVVSRDGNYVSFFDATPNAGELYNVATGTITPFSVPFGSIGGEIALSDDGSHAAYFASPAGVPANLYLEDLQTKHVQLLRSGLTSAISLALNSDGRYVSFIADGVGPIESDVWVVDTTTGQGVIVADDAHNLFGTAISSDGTQVAFPAGVNADSNPQQEVYVAKIGPADSTPPTITASLSQQPNAAGWSNQPVTVTFTCSDADSGVAICPAPVTVSQDTAGTVVSGTATDNAGNTASASVTVKLDQTPPTVSNLKLSPNLILLAGNVNISANASDTLSGIAKAEYYIDTDPGQGDATPLTYDASTGKLSGNYTVTLGHLSLGKHTIYVRVQDAAGNWSALSSATFFAVNLSL